MRKITFLFVALVCASVMGWAAPVEGSSTENMDGQPGFTNAYAYSFSTNGTDVTLSFTNNDNVSDLVGILWHFNPGLTEKNMTVSGNTASITLTGQTPGSTIEFACKFAFAANPDHPQGMSVTKHFTYTVEGGGGGSTPDPGPEPTPSVSPYCDYEVGHFGDPSADVNSFILLSIGSDGHGHTIVNIKQDADKNSNSFDYINVVGIKEIGSDVTTGGKTEMAIIFNTPTPDGDGNIKFSLQWSKVGDGGRWLLNDITVPANAICENADPFPGDNTYCDYTDNQLRANNANVALTWSTDVSGNVVIDISDGEGATNSAFRNGGFENEGSFANTWWVYSGTNHSVVESADVYFNAGGLSNGDKRFTLVKKAELPANAVIAFFGHAFSWKNTQAAIAYHEKKYFAYEYGYNCPSLDAPTNVAIDGTNHITFDAVTNAQTYTASVYLNGIVKHRQVVNNGDELTFQPYTTGTYQVEVVADAEGYPTSDPSDAYDWELTAPAIGVGNSEYCEWPLPKHNNQDANLTWETGDDGAITITLSPLSEQTAVFRAGGMKLSDFTVGAARTAASAYFNRSYTAGGTTVVLTLKDANIAPGLGEKIYFSGYIECKVQDQDTWPNPSLEYTYGSKCSGQKHVTVSVNNNEMGSATVDGVAAKYVDEGTQVACVAIPASGYEFVNWTKGGVEVSTELTYTPTINTATDLVANFDYARTTYCHTAVTTNGGKKLYLTVGKGATEGTYQIKIYGSDELTITGINNANTAVNHIKYKNYDGNDVPLTITNGGWSFKATGYGVISSAEIQPQTNHTWRDIWMWRPDLYIGTSAGEQNINAVLNQQNHFNWNSTCSDAEAPAFNKAEAEVLNESSVRLKIQATDNWGGLLTYTIAREAAEPIISNHASGEEFTQDVTGLTAGTEYTFTVTVSDGVNNANQNIVVTPMGDSEPPVMGEARLESKTWNSAIINVAATDNKGVTAYYVVEKAADYIATDGKITVTGLTAATPYTFHIKAKDAAGNISNNQAEVVFTTDAHSLVPTTAAPVPTLPENQVKSIYSDTYELAPAQTPNYNAPWWGAPAITLAEIDGNHYMDYNLANDGMIGWQYDQISVATMEKLHIDIYASAAGTVSVRPITDGDGALNNNRKTLTLVAQQWNSFDIDLTEFGAHDWTKLFQFSIGYWAAGGLLGEHISVDNVYFYRTTPPPADETAPTDVIANKTEENFASVKLSAQANDDSGVVHFRVQNGTDVLVADVEAVSGAEVAITINNLTPNTNYTFSVVAFDEAGHEAEPVNVAVKTKALPSAAPQPAHDAVAVLSVYSNAYDPAVAATFNRANWGSAPVELESDYILYSMTSNVIVWGNSDGNAGYGNIDGLSGKTHGETPGLDVSGMTYIHFDVWCEVADQLNTVNINDQAVAIPTTRTIAGEWVSFDVDITGVALADRQNVRWLKFHPFTNCFAAIDNVYFWSYGVTPNAAQGTDAGGWATFASPVDLAVPDGLTAYKASYQKTETEEILNLSPISVIPANAGVILKGNAGEAYTFAPATEPAPDMSGNVLVGCVTRTDVSAVRETKDIFCMRYSASYDFTGFFLYEGQYVPANRAYLPLDKVSGSNNAPAGTARRVRFVINEEQVATDVENAKADSMEIVKFFENGQLYIRRGEAVYNLQGVRVK